MSGIEREREEERRISDYPHVGGVTRGTVVEYDGWQWAVITEIAEETYPTKVGFVLLDRVGDDVVAELESAWGCWEHYQAAEAFRGGHHEYWTPLTKVVEDDIWEVLGPLHPDAREVGADTESGVGDS